MEKGNLDQHPRETEELRLWALSRIDIRSPVAPSAWPVARVELVHPVRGRVTDVASAPGAFDAVFAAAGQILGIAPTLVSYNVYTVGPDAEGALGIRIDIELDMDGRCYRGSCHGVDLVRCSLTAWLDAACQSLAGIEAGSRVAARPHQVSGVDENGDLWLFASADEDAARAIAEEFRADGYSEMR
jgi:hypothetical protein